MDEKNFIIGICHVKKHVVSKKMLANKKLLDAVQNGFCEFVTFLACICTDGTTFPLVLIYQSTSGDLQDTWLEDYNASKNETYFTSLQKNWINENLKVSWLEKMFMNITNARIKFHNYMLIVDNHSSHVNWCFIEFCNKNAIILNIFLFHSTHCLQLLDLKIFGVFIVAYSNEIDLFI